MNSENNSPIDNYDFILYKLDAYFEKLPETKYRKDFIEDKISQLDSNLSVSNRKGVYHIKQKHVYCPECYSKDIVENGIKDREVEEEDAEKLCSEKEIDWGGECSAKSFSPQDLKEILINTWKNYVEKFGIKEEISGQKRMEGSKYKKKS